MEKSVIKIKNLMKNYKMYHSKQARLLEIIFPKLHMHHTFTAIDNLDLELRKGDVLGILGRNGAGKSTLLKIITGVVTPTSGKIEVNGKISSLLELGAAFNPELTGLENIYQHGQVMGLTDQEIEERKQDIIDFADIGDHLFQPVKTYSSGMFARLAFACAINVDPDILIVDEVLSVGDMAFQLKCFKKFEEFKEKGKTIIFVSHSISDIMKNCTRTIIMKSGKKVFDGNVKDGVNLYKKMIVGLETNDVSKEPINQQKFSDKAIWKKEFDENPNMIVYGNGKAEVIDYGIFDESENYLKVIEHNQPVIFKSKIEFHEDVKDPIFTMTIRDFNGKELAGTNTNIERVATGKYKKGDTVEVKFAQPITLCAGKYTLSFSCTYINARGDLEVYDRKYDALLFEVLSDKECVGIVDLNTKITIEKL